MRDLFDLTGKVAVVTGGAGLLGLRHCEALLAAGAQVVCLDQKMPEGETWDRLRIPYSRGLSAIRCDVTNQTDIANAYRMVWLTVGEPRILINNACNNPKLDEFGQQDVLSQDQWEKDLAVGLTGPWLCSMMIGSEWVQQGINGVILNIASEYGIRAPDQRLYHKPGLLEHQQPIKPTSYSVVKHGIIGLTKWLATYYAGKGVRVNSLSPGGVYNGQDEEWVSRYVNTIPLGRMSTPTDYQGAVLFLCSEASAFMTGHNLVMDGGRSCW